MRKGDFMIKAIIGLVVVIMIIRSFSGKKNLTKKFDSVEAVPLLIRTVSLRPYGYNTDVVQRFYVCQYSYQGQIYEGVSVNSSFTNNIEPGKPLTIFVECENPKVFLVKESGKEVSNQQNRTVMSHMLTILFRK